MIIEKLLQSLRDTFPEQFVIGGSYARKLILNRGKYNDIDIYTTCKITTCGFKTFLNKIGLEGGDITFIRAMDLGPRNPYYKLPWMSKRIEVFVPALNHTIDFIFIRPPHEIDLRAYLLEYQASCVSECAVSLDYSPSGFSKKSTPNFNNAFNGNLSGITINTNHGVATKEHIGKVIELCQDAGLDYVLVDLGPYVLPAPKDEFCSRDEPIPYKEPYC